MIRRAPQWYTGKEKRWKHFNAIWPWVAGFSLGGLYYYNSTPLDDVMRAGFASVRWPMLRAFSSLENLEDDKELEALDLPPDRLFGPLPLKQQIFFTEQALEEENELGDSYITRIIIDRIIFGLDRVADSKNEFYEHGGKGIHDEAIKRYRDLTNQRVKFFNCDRFIRLLNISLESKEISRDFLSVDDGIALILKAMKETTELYTPHLGTRALALLAIHQPQNGVVENRIAKTPDAMKRLCEMYANSAGDPHETRFVTLLLSSILRTVPDAAKLFISGDGVKAVFSALNVAQCKGVPQHLRVYKDLWKKDPKAVQHYLHAHESPMPILLGVAKNFTEYFGIQEQLYDMLNECVAQRGVDEFVSYGGMDIMHKAITMWPDGRKETAKLHEKWRDIYRRILQDPQCTKLKSHSAVKNSFQEAEQYLDGTQTPHAM